ncbi:MAG: 50S ribosomal protein L11 methyltransferase [Desulfurivibrionaceae bacterium]
MLKPPYTFYEHLYVYHLDLPHIPKVNDPDLIGVWMEDDTAVLFFHREKDALIKDICKVNKCELIYQADLSYQDWESGQNITGFTIDSLRIAPVWDNAPADIRIDPSVIFGSGFHPTTRTCLELLLKYLTTPEIKIKNVLDLGAGTGLLSIAAAHLGAEQVSAIDNNNLACQVAGANCRLNNVEDRVTVRQQDLLKQPPDTGGSDLIIANLYRGLLQELFSLPAFWEGGLYILSGFIQPMEADLLADLPSSRIRFLERKRKDRWCVWVLANRDIL